VVVVSVGLAECSFEVTGVLLLLGRGLVSWVLLGCFLPLCCAAVGQAPALLRSPSVPATPPILHCVSKNLTVFLPFWCCSARVRSECITEPKEEVEESNRRMTRLEELVEVGANLNFLCF